MEEVRTEPILEPDLPIVDAHHHLWLLSDLVLTAIEEQVTVGTDRDLLPVYRSHARYLLEEFLTDAVSGHRVEASVFADSRAMYRTSGAESLKSVGEVEFVNGVAAAAASGVFGPVKVCAGIVGGVDLRLGAAVEEVLAAHLQAGGHRYRGVRSCEVAYDEDERILGPGAGVPHLLLDASFRAGLARLQQLGLSLDVLVLEPQLPELLDLAHAFPNTQMILEHVGCPLGTGRYAGQREARFTTWRLSIQALARCPNVAVKLGGLGVPFVGFRSFASTPPATSQRLAEEWKPYIATCIEAFGAERCMFESNFPVDAGCGSYAIVWNAFKRLAAQASASEKAALFSGTARRIYKLEI